MIPTVDYIRILPELVLSIFGILVMLVDPVIPTRRLQEAAGHDCPGRRAGRSGRHCLPDRAITATPSSTWCASMPSASSFMSSSFWSHWSSSSVRFEYLEVQQIKAGEYYGLILFATVGMMLMSSAIELVLIFIALEISSISTYILAGFRRRAAESAESSLKYFLLGSFATAFFLYGVAMMFGATGTTNIYRIAAVLSTQHSVLAYLAVALMFVGLGFKVASAPFHVWTPDVYEGAPAPVVGLHVHRPEGRRVCRPAARALRHRTLPDGSGWSGSRPCSP